MSKRTGYTRNILFSIIFSIIILLTLGFLSIKYLVPIYDLKSQDIYQFLIYLLPVLIGLALIEVGSLIASKRDSEDDDYDDLLPKNCYDAPLFNTINDDPVDKTSYSEYANEATASVSFKDTLDKELVQRFEKYNNFDIVKILDAYESNSNTKGCESPFDDKLTQSLFRLSTYDAKNAISWIESGSPLPIENSVVLENLNYETVQEIKKLSQREALLALDLIAKDSSFISLDHLDENTLLSLSLLDNQSVMDAIKWVHMGCPASADPNARVFENLDIDTQSRLEEYNSIQVNVGLDYIDEGAPDIEDPDSVLLPNVKTETVERLFDLNDEEINKALDRSDLEIFDILSNTTIEELSNYSENDIINALETLKFEVIDRLSSTTLDRLSNYNEEDINNALESLELLPLEYLNSDTINRLSNYTDDDINKGLDSLESTTLYNITDETLVRLNAYTSDQINSALDYIDEGSPDIETPNTVVLPDVNPETIDRLLDFNDEEVNKALDSLEFDTLDKFSDVTINRLLTLDEQELNKGLDFLESAALDNLNDETLARLNCYSSEQIDTGLNYVDDGAPQVEVPNSVLLENVNSETIDRLLDFTDEDINKGLDSLQFSTLDNLDDQTLLRLKTYDKQQINTGLDYIDDGAPQVEVPNSVLLENVNSETIDRLLDFNDEEINKGLDSLEFETLDNLSNDTKDRLSKYSEYDINKGLDCLKATILHNLNEDTLSRLNSYDADQVNSGLDYVDKGKPVIEKGLPFDEEINNAIKSFSSSEALKAVNFIKNIDLFDKSFGDLSNNLEDFLNSELNDNIQQGFNYDLSLAIFDKANVLSGDVKDILLSKLPTYTYVFHTSNENTAIIFPYESKEEAKKCIDAILTEESDLYDNVDVEVGYAGQENRQLDARTLINEAYLN